MPNYKFILFFLSLCHTIVYPFTLKDSHQMTIFIHGTTRPARITFSDIVKVMKKKIDNTIYSQAIKHIRSDPEFYKGQAMQGLGLKPVDLSADHHTNAAQTIAKLYDFQLDYHGIKPEHHYYYTFGWHGLMTHKKRYESSLKLYDQLHNELDNLAQKGIHPQVRIIAFSHGGNVALNLADIKGKDTTKRNRDLSVDELVMLATPVQGETDYFVGDPMFKKVFHIYSTEDNVQFLDFLGSKQFFSRRKFSHRRDFDIPDKLTQIRMRVVRKIERRHKANYPEEEPYKLLESRKIRKKHKDPGHTEMWNFNFGTYWYRNSFPLDPLPVAALVPTIVHTLETYQPKRRVISFSYSPEDAAVLLRERQMLFKQAVPFMDHDAQKKLWALAEKHRPHEHTIEKQEEHVAMALKRAKEDLIKLKRFANPQDKMLAEYFRKIDSGFFNQSPHFHKIRKIQLLSAKL